MCLHSSFFHLKRNHNSFLINVITATEQGFCVMSKSGAVKLGKDAIPCVQKKPFCRKLSNGQIWQNVAVNFNGQNNFQNLAILAVRHSIVDNNLFKKMEKSLYGCFPIFGDNQAFITKSLQPFAAFSKIAHKIFAVTNSFFLVIEKKAPSRKKAERTSLKN